jgi:hypothetical protein
VLDRMAPRWRRKIDRIDEAAAVRFGKRHVQIRWQLP